MNIKTLRKNYKELNEWERFSLFISAIVRKDKLEEKAVVNASPKRLWEKTDYSVLYERFLFLQLIVIIEKADAWSNWLMFSELEDDKADGHSQLALYFFFVYTDAWKAICERLKIDSEKMAEIMFPGKFSLWRIGNAGDYFRELAFTEDEARAFVHQYDPPTSGLEMTLENKIKEFSEFLELP